MKLTKRQAVRKHIKMWDWLAKHPGRWKLGYFQAHPRLTIPENECYFCDQARLQCGACLGAPVLWSKVGGCEDIGSSFLNWVCAASDEDLREKYAKQMVDGGRKILKRLRRKGGANG